MPIYYQLQNLRKFDTNKINYYEFIEKFVIVQNKLQIQDKIGNSLEINYQQG